MNLNIEFVKYANEITSKYLFKLGPIKNIEGNLKKTESSIDHVPSIKVDNHDIISMTQKTTNYKDEEICRSFTYKDKEIGLIDDDFQAIRNFIEKLSLRNEFRDRVGYEFLFNVLIKWFKDNYIGLIDNKYNFCQYLTDTIDKSIKQYKISVKIEYLRIEKAFCVGDVSFDFLTKDYFDELSKENKKKTDIEELRKKYQGRVLASVSIVGEKERCMQISKIKIDKALTLLRLFSPTILYDSSIPSYFSKEGDSLLSEDHFLIFQDKYPLLHSSINCKNNPIRFISNAEYEMLLKEGLRQAIDIFFKDDPTELEEKIIKSIGLLEKSITYKSLEEKILFTLSSVETILLKNNNEPIQSNIGRRIAYLISKDSDKRKQINKLVKDAYELRSKYIHHGEQSGDISTLNEIRKLIFITIKRTIDFRNKLSTHNELIQEIENLTWS